MYVKLGSGRKVQAANWQDCYCNPRDEEERRRERARSWLELKDRSGFRCVRRVLAGCYVYVSCRQVSIKAVDIHSMGGMCMKNSNMSWSKGMIINLFAELQ